MNLRYFCSLILVSWLVLGCGLRPQPKEGDTTPRDSGEVSTQSSPAGTDSGQVSSDSVTSREFARIIKEPTAPEPSAEASKLARTLVYEGQTERDKAHALYRWLGENVAYDVNALYSGDLGDQSPENVLRTRMAVCAGYADLFDLMAREVGLESKVVAGRSRSDDAGLPPKIRDSDTNHAWNAVKIDGRWELLDPTWGAGHVNEQREFVKAPNDDWFMVDPVVFRYSHLPEEPQWQLTDQVISRAEFESQPEMKPRFFDFGLELLEPSSGKLSCAGEMAFEIRSTNGTDTTALITSNGTRLDSNWGFGQWIDGTRQKVYVRFPKPGTYEVTLMGRKPGEKTSVDVASFEVTSTQAREVGYPEVYLTFYENRCFVRQPLDGRVSGGRPVRFDIEIPGVSEAFIKNGGEMTPMKRDGDRYTLDFTPTSGELTIMGRVDPNSTSVWAVLKYQVR